MSEKNQQLTSVKLDKDLFEQFRVECIKRKFSFKNYRNEQSTFI
jgi:hypothetical protein